MRNQVPGRCADRIASDGGKRRTSAQEVTQAEKRQRPYKYLETNKEGCSRSNQRPVRSSVEFQAGSGPLVRGTGNGTHRHGRKTLSAACLKKKIMIGARRRAWPRRQENRRRRPGDGSRPHQPSFKAPEPLVPTKTVFGSPPKPRSSILWDSRGDHRRLS